MGLRVDTTAIPGGSTALVLHSNNNVGVSERKADNFWTDLGTSMAFGAFVGFSATSGAGKASIKSPAISGATTIASGFTGAALGALVAAAAVSIKYLVGLEPSTPSVAVAAPQPLNLGAVTLLTSMTEEKALDLLRLTREEIATNPACLENAYNEANKRFKSMQEKLPPAFAIEVAKMASNYSLAYQTLSKVKEED